MINWNMYKKIFTKSSIDRYMSDFCNFDRYMTIFTSVL